MVRAMANLEEIRALTFSARLKGLCDELGLSDAQITSALAGVIIAECEHHATDPIEFMRWAAKSSVRRFGPKKADHPTVGHKCQACHKPFAEGDFTALVPLGPGDDEEARARAREGAAYTGVAIELHYACVTGEP